MLALVAHLILICLVSSWPGALGYFAVSYLIVRVAGRATERARPWAVGLGIGGLVATLLILRGSPALAPLGLAPWGLQARSLGLQFVGLSYCFLRAVYALLEPRHWRPLDYARYYFFFPTFISGPVSRPEHHDAARTPTRVDLREGLSRVGYGLVLVLAAHSLSLVTPLGSKIQLYWALDQAQQQPLTLWLGVLGSGLWLYLDFSGYSDIFIGLARLTGVRAPENFARPFAASDITAFWQRWHMSLADWLRGVVYTPLSKAGLRFLPAAAVGSLAPIATMTACGLWHRVSPGFLLWGALMGAALGAHSLWRLALPNLPWRPAPLYRVGSWLATHLFLAASLTLFLPVDDTVPLSARLDLLRSLLGVG